MKLKDHPNCGTPDCCGKCATANVTEEMTTAASIPNPADTSMGPKFKPKTVTDRRRKKQMVLLKRFRKYMEDNA